jgi:2-amino-4-hydroxy-6-hydroxymethyldihydropteridine diphosphokinase
VNTQEVKQHILAYIGFGSNVGERARFFEKARQAINSLDGTVFLRSSPLYKTEPHTCDGSEQPWYLNAVFEIQTCLSPLSVLQKLKVIEGDLGRVPAPKWQPRCVDLDLLLCGDEVISEADFCVPHPAMTGRRFVLQPLNDLVPDKVHPVLKKTLREMLAECQDVHQCLPASSSSF